MNLARVRVDLSPRGAWEVVLPERVDRLRCKTVEEASRIAHRLAAARRPCELIVYDAYHRVVEHELIQLGAETLTAVRAAVALREPGPDAAESHDEQADDSQTPRSDESRAEELPLADYNALSAVAITKRLSRLSPAQLSAVHAYEQSHRNRKTVCKRIAALQSADTRATNSAT
jgi:hypothetical protein